MKSGSQKPRTQHRLDSFFLYSPEDTKYLTAEEEIELGRRISQGDIEARNELVEHNFPLVVNIARRFMHSGLDVEDVIQEGNMGLVHAADKFDYTKGFRFTTYATWWIVQRIHLAITKQLGTSDTSKNGVYMASKIEKARQVFNKEHGRDPTNTEMAEIVGLTQAQLSRYIYLRTMRIIYLGDKLPESEETLDSLIPDAKGTLIDTDVINEACVQQLKNALDELPDRDRDIFLSRQNIFGVKRQTCEALGEQFNISRERVRQIDDEVRNFLRQYIEEENNSIEHKPVHRRESIRKDRDDLRRQREEKALRNGRKT